MKHSNRLYIEIGKRIHQARSQKGLTQARLAEIISFTRTSITNIEKGRQKILLDTLYDLANALEVNPKDLLPEQIGKTVEEIDQKLPKGLSNKEISWVKSVIGGTNNRGN